MDVIKIAKQSQNLRLDQFLKNYYGQTRSYFAMLNKNLKIKVNGKFVKNGYLLNFDDIIEIDFILPMELKEIKMNLDIVFEDDDLLVINKPKGLVVHPAKSYKEPTLVHGILGKVENTDASNRPGVVHRLDKDTSGLLIIAKNRHTLEKLSLSFKNHQVVRKYLAIVHGIMENDYGTIDSFLKRDPNNRTRFISSNDPKNAKRAITNYKILKRLSKITLVELTLVTGRTHQIRVHLKSIGHCIYGDPLYGISSDKKSKMTQYLHSYYLSFIHPRTNQEMVFISDYPQEFVELINS